MKFIELTSLPDHSISVLHPLRAVVRPKDGVYMASLEDTNISASGESLAEAVDNLKDIVAAKFRLFSREENILGKRSRHQLHVLRQSLLFTNDSPPEVKLSDCWLVVRYMHELGHPLAWEPIAVYDNKQQAQIKAASLGMIERFDGKFVPSGRIEKLPRF